MDVIFNWIIQYGYPVLFALLMLGIVGLPLPDETLLTFAGYLVFVEELALLPTIGAAVLGSICGIMLRSWTQSRGRYLVARIGSLVKISPGDLDHVEACYARWGKYMLLVGYFIPGIRHLVAWAAGSSRLPLPVFMTFAYTSAVICCGTFIALGYINYIFGEEWADTSATIHRLLIVLAGTALSAVGPIFILRKRRTA
jgi:membrane protein DedA with SNARE-associated domain